MIVVSLCYLLCVVRASFGFVVRCSVFVVLCFFLCCSLFVLVFGCLLWFVVDLLLFGRGMCCFLCDC